MKAVILAGGYGERLRPLTYTKPKPMLPLLDKPVLQHIVEGLAAQGFDEILVTTNYLREQVIGHFKSGEEFGVKMIYPLEEKPLGTAGSVKNAEKYLSETFAVVQGDGISDINLKNVLNYHNTKNNLVTIVLTAVNNPREYGVVELNHDSEIIKFREKPKSEDCFSNLVNTGLYIIEPEVLKYIPEGTEYDFARDLFPKLLTLGKEIGGYRSEDFWVDIGQPNKYIEAIHWTFEKRKNELASKLAIEKQPSMILGKGTKIDVEAKIEGQVLLKDGCSIGKGAIITGCSVIEKDVEIADEAKIEDSIIYQGSDIGRCSHIDRSIVAEECIIGDNVEIEESVVGAGCRIGNNAILYAGSRVWPRLEVKASSALRGIVQYL